MTTLTNPFEKVRAKMVAARIEVIGQLARFSKDELSRKPDKDEWSALEIAQHLYIADGVALEDFQKIQSEENPVISDAQKEVPRLTREAIEEEQTRQRMDLEPLPTLESLLSGMAARREEIFEYLASLPDEAWERPFQHQAWGPMKFYQLVNVVPQHDQQHVQQLKMLKESFVL